MIEAGRKPVAQANWKMAMTVAESLGFVAALQRLAGDLLDRVDVILCPPFTALWPLRQALADRRIQLGAQNLAASADPAHTGQISAALLADAGCAWAMLGHWEIRRHLGDDDAVVNRKLHLALAAGLKPIVLVGEAGDEPAPLTQALARQLTRVLEGCQPAQVASMILEYEPEGAIGLAAPISPDHAAAGCEFIRGWLRARWGGNVAGRVRIIYGGSVAPEHVSALMACPDIDGLAATRRGRDASTFAQIIRWVAQARPGAPA